jgi:hypothetical protein
MSSHSFWRICWAGSKAWPGLREAAARILRRRSRAAQDHAAPRGACGNGRAVRMRHFGQSSASGDTRAEDRLGTDLRDNGSTSARQYLFGDEANLTPKDPGLFRAEPAHELSAHAKPAALWPGRERVQRQIIHLQHLFADFFCLHRPGPRGHQPTQLQPGRTDCRHRRHPPHLLRARRGAPPSLTMLLDPCLQR